MFQMSNIWTREEFLSWYRKMCSVDVHSSFECDGAVKCANCGGDHMSNSRVCEHYKKEFAIQKLKAEEKITYQEARKRLSVPNNAQPSSYADKVRGVPTTRTFETQTVFTWPNGSTLPILVSEFEPQTISSTTKKSSTSSSSQTPSTSLAFNHFEMADIYANSDVERKMREHFSRGRQLSTSSKTANAKQNNQSTKSPSPKKDKTSQQKNRSASSEKINNKQSSGRLKKAEKALFNKYEVLSSAEICDDEAMDTSILGDSSGSKSPDRGRQHNKTREKGRFLSCSPNTDERRQGKISPIRLPPR